MAHKVDSAKSTTGFSKEASRHRETYVRSKRRGKSGEERTGEMGEEDEEQTWSQGRTNKSVQRQPVCEIFCCFDSADLGQME